MDEYAAMSQEERRRYHSQGWRKGINLSDALPFSAARDKVAMGELPKGPNTEDLIHAELPSDPAYLRQQWVAAEDKLRDVLIENSALRKNNGRLLKRVRQLEEQVRDQATAMAHAAEVGRQEREINHILRGMR